MSRALSGLLIGTAILAVPNLSATSVRPPNLDDLLATAEWVAQGTVTATRSEIRTTAAGPQPFTIVTFETTDTFVGAVPSTIELVLLGGAFEDKSMTVAGQPDFHVGDREVLFIARNGKTICPVVRMSYGRFRLFGPTGTSTASRENPTTLSVYRQNFSPLTQTEDISKPMDLDAVDPKSGMPTVHSIQADEAATPNALSLIEFRDAITDRATALGRNDVHLRQP